MINMDKFTSLLEIGFALHFAFPIMKTFWEKRFNNLVEDINKIGTNKYVWRNIVKNEGEIDNLIDELSDNYNRVSKTSTFIKFASITSICIAIYNILLLLIIAYGGLESVSYLKSILLISIALLPMPLFLIYVYFRVTKNIDKLKEKESNYIFNLVRDKKKVHNKTEERNE